MDNDSQMIECPYNKTHTMDINKLKVILILYAHFRK